MWQHKYTHGRRIGPADIYLELRRVVLSKIQEGPYGFYLPFASFHLEVSAREGLEFWGRPFISALQQPVELRLEGRHHAFSGVGKGLDVWFPIYYEYTYLMPCSAGKTEVILTVYVQDINEQTKVIVKDATTGYLRPLFAKLMGDIRAVQPIKAPVFSTLNIPIEIRNEGDRGKGRIFAFGKTLWEGTINKGEVHSLDLSFDMPCSAGVQNIDLQSITECGNWRTTRALSLELAPIFQGAAIDLFELPNQVAAGEPFNMRLGVVNHGAPGGVKLRLDTEEILSRDLEKGGFARVGLERTMPYDDTSLECSALSVAECGNYQETDHRTGMIKAGFPEAIVSGIQGTEEAACGENIFIKSNIVNRGFRGDIGIKTVNTVTDEETTSDMARIDRDMGTSFDFSTTMPASSPTRFNILPQWVGRYKETYVGELASFDIRCVDSTFVDKEAIFILGGSEEYEVAGLIAAETLGFTDEKAEVKSPVSLPFITAVPFVIRVGVREEIPLFTYTKLHYLRLQISKEVSIAKDREIAAVGVKEWEYSRYPSPFAAISDIRRLATGITLPRARIA